MPEVKPGPKVRKPRTKDLRPSNVQFQDKGAQRVRLILESLQRLGKFGSSRGARPNLTQVEWVEATVTQATQEAFAELRRGLKTGEDGAPAKPKIEVPLG